jgi:DNA polymerase
MGCRGFDCSQGSIDTVLSWGSVPAGRAEALSDIRSEIGDCKRCRLSEARTQIVFGSGDARAPVMFIGEGPGFDEDRQGEPFVGAAGQLLTKIIQAVHLSRDRVYIANIVKCRPPQNRNPLPDEIDACVPFLMRQISAIHPEFICALGSVAAQTLLQSRLSISKLRGKIYSFMDSRMIATYHPAFLLRNPESKRDVWEDMKLLMKEMAERPWYPS